jgi:hypothetical protein
MDALIKMAKGGFIDVGMDGNEWLKELGKIFARYEIPMGLMNKLIELEGFDALHFVIDDSGSMSWNSDALGDDGRVMTRWQEARQRLKTMMTVLAFIPVVVCFLNRCDVIKKKRDYKQTPEQFVWDAHAQIDQIFNSGPTGGTPMLKAIKKSFEARGKIAHYFFGDGAPSGGEHEIEQIKKLIMNRSKPKDNPVTFLSCSNEDEDVQWMSTVRNTTTIGPRLVRYWAIKGMLSHSPRDSI